MLNPVYQSRPNLARDSRPTKAMIYDYIPNFIGICLMSPFRDKKQQFWANVNVGGGGLLHPASFTDEGQFGTGQTQPNQS